MESERSLYTVYLPKVKGESVRDRKINNLFKEFSRGLSCICDGKYTIISSPGYLSRSDKEIENYFTHLSGILSGTSISIGYLKGMNSPDIIEKHYSFMDRFSTTSGSTIHFNKLILNIDKNSDDHRKMLFFLSHDEMIDETVSIATIDGFLESISVNGVLIGSTNQSNSSFFDNTARKGEADVFMFYGLETEQDMENNKQHSTIRIRIDNLMNTDAIASNLPAIEFSDNNKLSECVISKCISSHACDRNYLKSILGNVLNSGLSE